MIITLLAAAALIPQLAAAQQPERAAAASLRVAHLSPNAPALSVYIDGQRIFQAVDYATTSAYRPIAPGKHRLQVSLASDSPEQAIVDTSIDLIRGRPYTVAALNTLEELQAHLLSDSVKSPPGGQARVRVVHSAPNAGPLDIWAAGSNVPLLTDQYFGQADYLNLPAGQYTFRFSVAGTDTSLFESQQLSLEPGWTYTIAVAGNGAEANEPLILHASVDRVAS
jgi:hypothetical protein